MRKKSNYTNCIDNQWGGKSNYRNCVFIDENALIIDEKWRKRENWTIQIALIISKST